MRYGTPYKGGKNAIAPWVVEHLPAAETFVDLFAGGCAVTHAAMLSGKFERFIANDLGDAPAVFRDAINGEFEAFDKWLSVVPFMVIVSEYTAPGGCVEVAARKKRVTSGSGNKVGGKSHATERLFVQERFADEYCERVGEGELPLFDKED